MNNINILSHAKINLTLEVLFRRDDGFHQIESVMQEIMLADSLWLEELPGGKIELSCDDPSLPVDERNLACRAASGFIAKFAPGKGVKIDLHKRIPLAAGLGGGSSNAAAVLKGLRRMWGIPGRMEDLNDLAASLGSDVTFFLRGGTALAKGRGELVTAVAPFPQVKVLLASPKDMMLSAAEVYSALVADELSPQGKARDLIRILEHERLWEREEVSLPSLQELFALLTNDLEKAAFSLKKEIALLKDRLQGMGLVALLSGSGPTVFALSKDEGPLERAYHELKTEGYRVCLTETKRN